jgi:hypothetical protein
MYLDTSIGKKLNAAGGIFLGVLAGTSKSPCIDLHGRCSYLSYTYNVVGVDSDGDDGLPASVTI